MLFLVSSYYLVHNISITSICVVMQVYVPITLFVVHFFSFNNYIYIYIKDNSLLSTRFLCGSKISSLMKANFI